MTHSGSSIFMCFCRNNICGHFTNRMRIYFARRLRVTRRAHFSWLISIKLLVDILWRFIFYITWLRNENTFFTSQNYTGCTLWETLLSFFFILKRCWLISFNDSHGEQLIYRHHRSKTSIIQSIRKLSRWFLTP